MKDNSCRARKQNIEKCAVGMAKRVFVYFPDPLWVFDRLTGRLGLQDHTPEMQNGLVNSYACSGRTTIILRVQASWQKNSFTDIRVVQFRRAVMALNSTLEVNFSRSTTSLSDLSLLFGTSCVAYFLTLAVYRLYITPSAQFPGPKLAALTFWYEFYYDCWLGGQYTWKIEELHKEYGKFAHT